MDAFVYSRGMYSMVQGRYGCICVLGRANAYQRISLSLTLPPSLYGLGSAV
jgi:hypothetical protein